MKKNDLRLVEPRLRVWQVSVFVARTKKNDDDDDIVENEYDNGIYNENGIENENDTEYENDNNIIIVMK